jgi:hypothetical protein
MTNFSNETVDREYNKHVHVCIYKKVRAGSSSRRPFQAASLSSEVKLVLTGSCAFPGVIAKVTEVATQLNLLSSLFFA